MNTTFLWLIFLIASLLVEILSSPGLFFFLAFSIGSAAAALVSWYGLSATFQVLAFLVLSAIAYIFLRSIMKRISKDSMHQSNVYALQGRRRLSQKPYQAAKEAGLKLRMNSGLRRQLVMS